jgi:hypothetical protein
LEKNRLTMSKVVGSLVILTHLDEVFRGCCKSRFRESLRT